MKFYCHLAECNRHSDHPGQNPDQPMHNYCLKCLQKAEIMNVQCRGLLYAAVITKVVPHTVEKQLQLMFGNGHLTPVIVVE